MAYAPVPVGTEVRYHGSQDEYHGLYTVRVVPSAFVAGYVLVDPNDGVALYDVHRESFTEHRDVKRGA